MCPRIKIRLVNFGELDFDSADWLWWARGEIN